jgi:hypothetical protein
MKINQRKMRRGRKSGMIRLDRALSLCRGSKGGNSPFSCVWTPSLDPEEGEDDAI